MNLIQHAEHWRVWWSMPLHQLVVAQLAFLVLGKTVLEFNIGVIDILAAVVTAVATELLMVNVFRREVTRKEGVVWYVPYSAIAAAFGIGIFFRSSSVWFFVLAAFVAIASKFFLHYRGAHIFNPSNIAVVLCVFMFPAYTTIEMTQWGNDTWLYLLIAAICLFISYRAQRLVATMSFLVTYAVALTAFIAAGGYIYQVHHYGLLGPSLLLFSAFMITDPKTSPSGVYAGLLHGMTVAMLYFVIEGLGIRYALFVASFATALLTFISKRIYDIVPLQHIPPNGYASVCAVAAFVILAAQTLFSPSVEWRPPPSLSFLLKGVEAGEVYACAANAQFAHTLPVGIAPSRQTPAVAWADFNNDRFDDLYVASRDTPSSLYANDREGNFIQHALPPEVAYAESGFFVDYDNDGWEDLFLVYASSSPLQVDMKTLFESPVAAHPIRVLKNIRGEFVEVTSSLGLNEVYGPPGPGTLSFGDYNQDGYIDMAMSTPGYHFDVTPSAALALEKSLLDPGFHQPVLLSCDEATVRAAIQESSVLSEIVTETMIAAYLAQDGCILGRTYVSLFSGLVRSAQADTRITTELFTRGTVRFFENRYGKAFVERTEIADMVDRAVYAGEAADLTQGQEPFSEYSGRFFQPVSFDADGDGDVDVLVAVDFGANMFLRNDGNFRFTIETVPAGFAVSGSGMGVAVGDTLGRGALDVVVDNIRSTYLFRATSTAFVLERGARRINPLGVGWGILFLDYDMDGWTDLFIANGDSERSTLAYNPRIDRPLFRVDVLYKNERGVFREDFENLCADAVAHQPAAVSDFDNDGDPDIYLGAYGARSNTSEGVSHLMRNNMSAARHVAVRLRGVKSNRDAIGAVVTVKSDNSTQSQVVLAGDSFYSQSSKKLLFGVGTSTQRVDLEVLWPSGVRSVVLNAGVPSEQYIIEPR